MAFMDLWRVLRCPKPSDDLPLSSCEKDLLIDLALPKVTCWDGQWTILLVLEALTR